MKKILLILALVVIAVAVCYLGFKDNKAVETKQEEGNEIIEIEENSNENKTTSKSDEIGTAGSNIPLKDNLEEAKYQIEVAMQYKFEEIYADQVFDARIYVDKVYTAEDEEENPVLKGMKLGPNEIAFEVKYELKPVEGADITRLTIPDGEYDEESGWIKDMHRVGILRPNDDKEQKYKITDFGTGW